MGFVFLLVVLLLPLPLSVHAEDLGKLNANPFDVDSTANPFDGGNPFSPISVTNPFSPSVWR
jgi:hypothetical protein